MVLNACLLGLKVFNLITDITRGVNTAAELVGLKKSKEQIIEEAVRSIADCIRSAQISKLKSAYQYVSEVVSGLNALHEIGPSAGSNVLTHVVLDENAIHENDRIVKESFNRLREADKWAIEVFNDTMVDAHLRMEAFEIRLFCATMIYWSDRRALFLNWRIQFKFLFNDGDLRSRAFSLNHIRPRIYLDEKAKLTRQVTSRLMESLAKLIIHLVNSDSSLFEEAKNFSKFLNDNEIFGWKIYSPTGKSAFYFYGPDVVMIPRTDNKFRMISLTEEVMKNLSTVDLDYVCRVREGVIWAIDKKNRIVLIDEKSPNQLTVIDGSRSWEKMGCAELLNKVYASGKDEEYISIFDATTGRLIVGEQIEFPRKYSYWDKWWPHGFTFVVAANGLIITREEYTKKNYARFPSGGSWVAMQDFGREETLDDFHRSNLFLVRCANGEYVIRLSVVQSLEKYYRQQYVSTTDDEMLTQIISETDGGVATKVTINNYKTEIGNHPRIKLLTNVERILQITDQAAAANVDARVHNEPSSHQYLAFKILMKVHSNGDVVLELLQRVDYGSWLHHPDSGLSLECAWPNARFLCLPNISP